jgi:predicted small lipoprotein YifL
MIKRLVFATFLLCTLGACGNKGPLVMPDPPADLPAPPESAAPAEATVPATTPEGASGTPAARH